MKRIAIFAVLTLAGLSGPTPSAAKPETAAVMFSRCIGKSMTADRSTDCVDMRRTYRTEIRDCMATLQAEADLRAGTIGDNNAHAYKARYLICAGAAEKALGSTGR